MANTVLKDIQGPDWPLGNIKVVTPGTPISIMSLVDASNVNAPETPSPPLAVGGVVPADPSDEYTRRAQQIIFSAYKAGAGPPALIPNTGNVYIRRISVNGTTGVNNDLGTIVATLQPGQTFILGSAALNRNVYNLYRYLIDADNANDSCQVTAIIQ